MTDIDELLDNQRWKAVGSGARALVAQVTTTEARALRDPVARAALETFFRKLRESMPRLDGALVFLRDDTGRLLGWGELRVRDDGFEWESSQLPPEP